MKKLVIFIMMAAGCLEGVQDRPHEISQSIWKEVFPYLLPESHPSKRKLDKIFANNCLENGIELYKAGFRFIGHKNPKKVIVAKHPELKGIVIKLFLENQPSGDEWPYWIKRIQGAHLIRQTIEEKGYTASFKVPNKWIYLLPYPKQASSRRRFILIAEDMKIASYSDNRAYWKRQITYEQVYMFWDLLDTCGLFDSIYIDNVPYCKDGRLAFIDTEHFLKWPIDYRHFNKYLKGGKLKLWKTLTGQG